MGDEAGYLKIWDLTPVMERVGISKVKPMSEMRTAFNPFRQERVNCSDSAKIVRQLKKVDLPELNNPANLNLLIREVKAHDDVITAL